MCLCKQYMLAHNPIHFSCQFTLITVPGPVQDLVSAQNFSTIVLTWNEPETLNGILIRYEVQYWQQSDPTNIKNETTGLNRMFILSNFTAGVIFTFNVTAFTRIGGGPSETIQAGTTPRKQFSPNNYNYYCVFILFFIPCSCCSGSVRDSHKRHSGECLLDTAG